MRAVALPAIRARWFWYTMACVLSWAVWVITAKFASVEISASTLQFIFTFGSAPVPLLLLAARRFRLEKSVRGIGYGIGHGVLGAAGNVALYAAYRTGGNTAVVTAVTALYPMFTVAVAVVLLRERLTRSQLVGLGFSAFAIVLFSL